MRNNIFFSNLFVDDNGDNQCDEELCRKNPKQIDEFRREKRHFSKEQIYITICTFTQTVCALIMTYIALTSA